VDFEKLARDLDAVRALYEQRWPNETDWRELHATLAGGRIKQLATWRLLQLRRERAELFRDGAYIPLAAEGPAAEHVVAFLRVHESQAALVVTTRLTYTLCNGDDAAWGPGVWDGTYLRIPAEPALRRATAWRDWLTGADFPLAREGELPLAPLFVPAPVLPFAVLLATP
jgi:(1->4)-alpha-D-glucan 1-alpha-D-glucosylmutase